MARYSAGWTPANVGSATLPCAALLSSAATTPLLREMAVFNTTATACNFEIVLISGGTAGAGQTEIKHRRNSPDAEASAVTVYSVAPTVDARTGYIFELGAAIGDGTIEVFGGNGLEAALGATAGIGLLLIAGAPATAPRVRFVWDE